MNSRWLKIKKMLTAEKAGALLVINSEENGQPGTQYLSGFSGSSSVILITTQKRILITDSRYTTQAESEATGFTIIILKSRETASAHLKNWVKQLKIKSILIDGTITSYASVENLKKTIPELKIVSKNNILQELRVVKDAREIATLKMAAKIACRAFLKFLPEIKVGLSEKTLADRLDSFCKSEGADAMAFDTIVASGPNGALPHAHPTNKRLKFGDLVVIDWGVKYKGYVSDMTRTVAIGKISPKLQAMYDVVYEAQMQGCKKAKAGITGHELDAVCRDFLKSKGFEKYFGHAAGHGIGMEIHELPVISPKQNDALPVGAVITCEPGVYIPGVGGVRIEDSLILTKNGSINLSKNVGKKSSVINPKVIN